MWFIVLNLLFSLFVAFWWPASRMLSSFSFNLSTDWELPKHSQKIIKELKQGATDMLLKYHLFSWDLWEPRSRRMIARASLLNNLHLIIAYTCHLRFRCCCYIVSSFAIFSSHEISSARIIFQCLTLKIHWNSRCYPVVYFCFLYIPWRVDWFNIFILPC